MSAAPFAAPLGPVATRFLALKRALGRGYAQEETILRALDAFLTAAGPADLTAATFAAWGQTLRRLMPGVRRNWLRIARNLLYTTGLRRGELLHARPAPPAGPMQRDPVGPPYRRVTVSASAWSVRAFPTNRQGAEYRLLSKATRKVGADQAPHLVGEVLEDWYGTRATLRHGPTRPGIVIGLMTEVRTNRKGARWCLGEFFRSWPVPDFSSPCLP